MISAPTRRPRRIKPDPIPCADPAGHLFEIPTPGRDVAPRGVCTRCGQSRMFSNSLDTRAWRTMGQVQADRGES